jgi:hypothetical protein
MKYLWLGLAGVALWATPSSAQESIRSTLPIHETRRVP